MPGTIWSTQQLAEFLAVFSSARTEASAALAAVERAAEALDAEVAAIVSGDELIASVGYPEGSAPVAELAAVTPGAGPFELCLPGVGPCAATAVSLAHPRGATFVLARSSSGGLSPEEAGLLRGMAQVTSMTLRTLSLLADERAARQESERQAAENARLLTTLTERQNMLERLVDEQAALRRVATLVAQGAPPAAVFAAVTQEVGQLLPVDFADMGCYEPDRTINMVATWGRAADRFPVGSRWVLDGKNLATIVFETRRSARIDNFFDASGPLGLAVRAGGVRSAVGTPITVEGRVWGVVIAGTSGEPLPVDTEARLASFTELVATAIANAESRADLARLAEEQAALRRVATLVAQGAPPDEVFAAVAEEVQRLLRVDIAGMGRYELDGTLALLASWGRAGPVLPDGIRQKLGGRNISTIVFETGHPARVDVDAVASDPPAVALSETEFRSSVGTPIIVEGGLWGLMGAGSRREPLPADTEERLAQFTELLATAIANAESRAALAASRARIVAAADEARRRIERDLHDRAQQRLVSLGLEVRAAQAAVPPELDALRRDLSRVAEGLASAFEELREISHGIHPAILSEDGLAPALRALARRSSVAVELELDLERRLPQRLEVAAYYIVSEALTNAAKHAHASIVSVKLRAQDAIVKMAIRDDGIGGAHPDHGSGLLGLTDRIEALGGRLQITSPAGTGTTLLIEIPLPQRE